MEHVWTGDPRRLSRVDRLRIERLTRAGETFATTARRPTEDQAIAGRPGEDCRATLRVSGYSPASSFPQLSPQRAQPGSRDPSTATPLES